MSIKEQILSYQVDGKEHRGFLCAHDDVSSKRPGVMIIHEWWGLDDYIRSRVRQIAGLGYNALAIDMYGGGQTADNPEQAGELMMGVLDNMDVGTRRLQTAYQAFCDQENVDAAKIAAMGYCFGGAMSLHMARLGMPLSAVVSFHGALGSFHQPEEGSIRASILVCHGGSDSMVPDEDLAAFHQEMSQARAEYRVEVYPGAYHGFTNPEATQRGEKYGLALAYDQQADKQSWSEMESLFSAVFG